MNKRLTLSAAVAAISLAVAAPASAQWTVFDPSNYAQNVLQAARSLSQVTNQITSLQNEAQMLMNQARNLASLPYSSLQQLQQSVARTQALLNQAQRLAYDVQHIDQQFQSLYAKGGYTASTSSQQMIADAQGRWKNSVAGFEDALKVQAGVVGNLDSTRSEMSALIGQSQGATGALQAAQAGNQLLALQAKQLADLTAVVAAQGRAQSLESARQAANQEQAREQLRRFLGGNGNTYEPQPVRMFHDRDR
jgi:P-type conjugative transfer protein TrbJ